MFTDKEKSIIENLSDRFSYIRKRSDDVDSSENELDNRLFRTSTLFLKDEAVERLFPLHWSVRERDKFPKGITERNVESVVKRLNKLLIKQSGISDDFELEFEVFYTAPDYVEVAITQPFNNYAESGLDGDDFAYKIRQIAQSGKLDYKNFEVIAGSYRPYIEDFAPSEFNDRMYYQNIILIPKWARPIIKDTEGFTSLHNDSANLVFATVKDLDLDKIAIWSREQQYPESEISEAVVQEYNAHNTFLKYIQSKIEKYKSKEEGSKSESREETIDLDKVDYEGLYLELKDKLPDEWWATESKRRTVEKLIYDLLFDRDTRGYQDIKEDVEAIYMRLEELYKPSPINVEYIELVKYLANKFVFPFDNEAVFSKLPPIDGTKTAYEYFLKKIIPFLDVEWLDKVDERFISYIKGKKELIGNIVFDIYKANKYKFEATEEDLRIVPESSIQRLRDAVSKIKTVDPSSEKYQELVKLIEKQKPFAQLQIYGADIRFVSIIAKHRLESKRRSIFDYIHRLYPNNKVPISVMKNGDYTIIKNEFTYKDSEPSYDRFLDRMYDYLIFESVLTKKLGRKLEHYLGYRLYKIATPLGLNPVEQNKDIEPLKKLMKNKVINEMINGIKTLFKENFDMSRADHYEWNIDFGTLGRSKDDAIAVNSYKDEQIVVQIWFDKIIISHNDTYNKTFKTIIEYDLHDLRWMRSERLFTNYLRNKTPQNIIDKLRGNKTNPIRKNGGGGMPQYYPPDFESKGMIPVEYYDCLEPIGVSFYAKGGTKLIKSKPYKPIPKDERVKVYFQLHAMKHPKDFYGTIEQNCEYTYNEIKKLGLPQEEENLRIGGSIYSIKHGKKWPVASHNRTVVLKDVVFTVQRSLLIKIKKEIAEGGSGGSAKVAGAFADGFYKGKLDSKEQRLLIDNWYYWRDSMLEHGYRQILFNPRFHDSFMVVNQWEGMGSWEYFQNTTLEERVMMEDPVYTAEEVYFLSDPYKLAHPRAKGYPYLILARGVNLKKDRWKVKVNTNTPKPYTISRVLKKPRGK